MQSKKKRINPLYLYGAGVIAAIAAAVGIAIALGGGDDKPKADETVAAAASQAPGGADDYTVVAKDIAFSKSALLAPPDTQVSFTLKNDDAARHSLQFLDKQGGKELAAGSTGKIIAGGTSDVVTFKTPGVGRYYFECAVHPGAMNGSFEAKVGAPPPPQVAASPAPAATGTTFAVVATNFQFDKTVIDAPAGQKLTFNLKNDGAARHSLQFLDVKGGKELASGATGKIIATGQTDVVTFTPPGAGTFHFECAVHPGAMTGTLKVAGGEVRPVNLDVVATNFQFDKPRIESPPGAKVTINLKNNGAARHSIQFLDAKGGKELTTGATGKVIAGGATDTVTFTAPAAGSYYFECGVHPAQMSGAFIVGGGGPPPTTTFPVVARNFGFDAPGFDAVVGSSLTFILKNDGAARHSIQFLDKKGGKELAPGGTGAIIAPGATTSLTFIAPAPGSYYFECAVHPAQMFGVLNVRAVGAPAPLPSVTAPAAVSRLQSGARVQVILATNLYQDPSGSARVTQALKVGDRLTVVTGTPAASTVVTTEGLIFWRVVIDGTQTIGWVPEVTSDGSRRFLDVVK